MEVFAATLPALLVNLDPSIPECPVLGWAHCGGGRCLPLVLGRPGGLVTGDAIRAEGTDHVFDLTIGQMFLSDGLWRTYIEDREPYRSGMTSPQLSYPGELIVKVEPPPETKIASLPKAGGLPPVQFGGKVYAKGTFWQAPEENPTIIFALEKNTPCPLNGALKITREEFYAARKQLAEVHQSAFSQKDPNQPELPLKEDPGDLDDDASDLI